MEKVILLLKKYREILCYIIFGILTTVVNILVYYLCTRLLFFDEASSNVIAWFISVFFAFVTNKIFVFCDKEKEWSILFKEIICFFFLRLLSLFFDMTSMHLLISILGLYDMFAKLITNIIVIVLNYVFSKLFVFNRKVG